MAAATDSVNAILSNALGGQFDAASFYRAKKAGYSDKDIVNAIKSAPAGTAITGQMKLAASSYDDLVSKALSGGKTTYSAGGQEWGPQLTIIPNKYNPYLQGADPYGGRFKRGEAQTRGITLSYGPVNAQEKINEAYWMGQIDKNPEVNYRWNTGDVLDPNIDIDNQYGRLAEMDLAGLGGSQEYKKLARERAENYEKYGPSATSNWRTGLHESDPRFAQIARDPRAYAEYFTETSPTRGSSEAARWIEEALSGKVMTPMEGGSGGTASTGLSGQAPKTLGGALSGIRSTGQRLGVEGLQALSERTGKDTAELVRGLRARNIQSGGEKGGLLTAEARQMYREATGKQPKVVTPAAAENRRAAKNKAERVLARKARRQA